MGYMQMQCGLECLQALISTGGCGSQSPVRTEGLLHVDIQWDFIQPLKGEKP